MCIRFQVLAIVDGGSVIIVGCGADGCQCMCVVCFVFASVVLWSM